MNKIINIGLTALFACFVAACENDIDNYDAPNGGVYGTIYDKETNEPVPMPVPGSSGDDEFVRAEYGGYRLC